MEKEDEEEMEREVEVKMEEEESRVEEGEVMTACVRIPRVEEGRISEEGSREKQTALVGPDV